MQSIETNPIDRLPPQNPDAEEAVLGSLLMDPEAVGKVVGNLAPGDFYRERNGAIYQAALDLARRREPVDYLTMSDELMRTNRYEEVGGMAYLSRLVGVVPTAVHVEQYADIVRRTAVKRRLISVAGKIAAIAYDDALELDDTLARATELLASVSGPASRGTIHEPGESVADFIDWLDRRAKGKRSGVRTGYDVDFLTGGGAQPGDLWVVGGYTGMGKSSLLQSMARRQVRAGLSVMLASAEMSDRELMKRDIAAFLRRSWTEDLLPALDAQDMGAQREVGRALESLAEGRVIVFTEAGMTTASIRREAARRKAFRGLDVLHVDYLQRLADQPATRNSQRYQDIAVMVRSLKNLALELSIPVFVAVQLGDGVAHDPKHRPDLQDMREGRDIAFEADVVLGINRPGYWPDAPVDVDHTAATLYLLKNRHGRAPVQIGLRWDGAATEYLGETVDGGTF